MGDPILLSRADLTALSRPTETATGLPGRAYTDPEFFNLEQRRLFARSWTCIGAAADVLAPGDVTPATVAGMPLILVRDRSGDIRVFHNVCSHRGLALVQIACTGRKVLQCPYHSWVYGLDGALKATPRFHGDAKGGGRALRCDTRGLRPVRTAVWAGLVFANVSGDAPVFDDWIRPLAERWPGFDFSLLRHAAAQEFELRANWKLVIENYLESLHLPWVHPALNTYSRLEDHYAFEAGENFVGQGTRVYQPVTLEGRALPRFPAVGDDRVAVGEYPVVFPNVMMGVHADHVFAIVVEPVAPALTRERLHIWYVGDGADASDYAAIRDAISTRWRVVNSEDIGIVQRLQAGRGSPAFEGGCFSPAYERELHRFQQLVARCLAAAD